jgi:peptidoglycan hydrolase FlgJ
MPSTQELNQICNIAGYPMYSWASDQLKKRSEILSNQNRTEDQINYLGNKGAWIRVVSSVNLEDSFIKYFKEQYDIDATGDSLAKKFILFGGTSTYESRLRSGINPGGSYALLGDTEVNAYGYRPMPGITSVTIESTGRMGSVRQATVNFRVSDKMQLDVMDALYFRPGFTLLIEYGHAKYIDNNGNLQSTESLMMDPFKNNDNRKENIGIEISRNIKKSAGNYGGMLSIITSFNFSITQDGGYDCVLKTIAMGGVMGNYPINKLSILPNVYVESVKKYLDRKKEEAIAAERKKAEDAAKAEAEKIQKSTIDNWTDLKITGSLANLLYNIYPEYLKPTTKDTYGPSPYTPGATNVQVPVGSLTTYNKQTVLDRVEQWKKEHPIENQDTGSIKAYLVKNDVTDEYAAVLIEKSDSGNVPGPLYGNNVSGKYIAAGNYSKQSGDIYVQINSDRIYSVFGSSLTKREGVQQSVIEKPTRVINDEASKEKYANWFEAIGKDKSIIYWPSAQENFSDEDRTKYYISIEYSGDESTAKTVYLNPTTKWKVDYIVSSGFLFNRSQIQVILSSNNYKIKLGYRAGLTTYYNADLSFISNIEGNQDLAKNKAAEQLNEIASRTAQNIADIKNKYELDTNAETLKAISNSQSALELMLRSIMLYAIDDIGKKQIKDTFIRDLFSEGAYSSIFKKFSNGSLPPKTYTDKDWSAYLNGTMSAKDRLEVNLRYGNSAYLMSAENANEQINLLQIIPQVDIKNIFTIVSAPYGRTADTNVNIDAKTSVYISLGLFFMMLNHTGLLYSSNGQDDVLTPVTYVDFNPSTNYYLSSINQFSIDPFKYLLPYYGTKDDYKKLFRKDILQNNDTIKLELSGSVVQPHSIFKFGQGVDKVTPVLPNNKKGIDGTVSNGYIGRTMDTMVNINHLLDTIKKCSTADDFGEAYFQTILETIIASLNKSTGYYNAFRLSYSDSANAFMIVDDHIQLKPDAVLNTAVGRIIENKSDSPEIPIQGKGSIARSFDIRTDISSRIASMIAISTNPGLSNQVGMAKNTSDFGVYNTGSHDRYMKTKSSDGSSNATSTTPAPIQNNVQECQAAINFDTVVSSIYGLFNNVSVDSISDDVIEQALAYYKEKMSRIKNEQPGSVAAMIIPIKSSITMDGFSGIYPFQLFTINENMLPYRYSQTNLKDSKVAFSTARLTHNFSNNEWTTSIEGFMTFLQKSDDQKTSTVTPSERIAVNITTNPPIITKSKTDFVKTYYPIAKIAGADKLDPIIILAQAAQESGWGNSNLAQNYNNFFGVTAGRNWTGRTYTVQRKPKPIVFRWYDSPQESFNGFVSLITNDSRYQKAEDVAKDYKSYAYQISISSYITEENGDDRNVYQNNIISNYEAILAILKKEKIN